jgi:hypothetical protein
MKLLKEDGSEMTMEEISALLILAALCGDKPEEVSKTAWVAACHRVWRDAENELTAAAHRLERAKQELLDAVGSAHSKMRQYIGIEIVRSHLS